METEGFDMAIEQAMDATATEAKESPTGFSKNVNDYLNTYVHIADAKAAALVAGNLVALGVIMSHTGGARNSDTLFHLMAVTFFMFAAGTSALVLFPRMPKGGKGLIFWEDIRTYTSVAEYQDAVRKLDLQTVEENFAYQNFYVSRVLHRKHILLRWAILFSASGAACTALDYVITWCAGACLAGVVR